MDIFDYVCLEDLGFESTDELNEFYSEFVEAYRSEKVMEFLGIRKYSNTELQLLLEIKKFLNENNI